MLTPKQVLGLAVCVPCALALACDGPSLDSFLDPTVGDVFDLTGLDDDEVEVDIFNDSDVAAHLMGPGEVQTGSTLVQPGGGRIAIVRFTPNGDVTFRATTDEGLFSLATWKFSDKLRDESFGGKKNGTVIFTVQHFLDCTGDLFAEN